MRPRISLLIALCLVLLSNGWVLYGVWQNRRQVTGMMELTERELCLPRSSPDNTGVFLQLIWDSQALRRRRQSQDGPGWFDRAKLAEIGFEVSRPLDDKEVADHYRFLPDKRVFVALEYDGPSSQGIPEHERAGHTRLFAIDVARDYQTLRRRYPDLRRHLILEGMVALVVEQPFDPTTRQPMGKPYLRGGVWLIEPGQIQVPLPHSRVLTSLEGGPCARPGDSAPPSRPPRYSVKLAFGRDHIPWVVGVRLVP